MSVLTINYTQDGYTASSDGNVSAVNVTLTPSHMPEVHDSTP